MDGYATAQEHLSNLLLHVLIHTVSYSMQAEKRSPPQQTNKASMAVKSTPGLKYIFHDRSKPLWRRRKYLTQEISLLFQQTNQPEIQFHNEKSKYRGLQLFTGVQPTWLDRFILPASVITTWKYSSTFPRLLEERTRSSKCFSVSKHLY